MTNSRVLGVLCALWLGLLASAPALASAQVCYQQPFGNPDLADPWGCTGNCNGWRDNPHRGLDYPQPCGTPIPAIADGVVVMNTYSGCLGYLVVLAHADGMYSGYNHMPSPSPLPVGASVSRGQVVGVVGDEGTCSGGCHLHLTVDYTAEGNWSGWYASVQVDPYSWIENHRVCRPDRDGDGSFEGDDCDDADAQRRPGLAESCDGLDNDCDDAVDEEVPRACGSDVGSCRLGVETCVSGEWGECIGDVPATDEICDTLDNDCDGEADEERICDDEDAVSAALVFGSAASSDVDGDGRADACIRTPAGFECLLASESGFVRTLRGPRMADEAGWSERLFYTSLRMGDVDGDGHADVCARDRDNIVCWPGSSSSFGVSMLTVPLGELSSEARSAEVWLADVDGRGRADVCVRDVDGLRCHSSEGGPAMALAALADDAGLADVTRHGSIRFGDIDGDGREDVCARLEDGLSCWRAGAVGFERNAVRLASWSDARGWGESRYGSTIRLVDVDGDGRADACGRGPDGFGCWLSLGTSFEPSAARGPSMRETMWDERSVYTTIRMGDVDGDGATDLCARTQEGVRCWLWSGEGFEQQVVGPALSDAEGWSASPRYASLRLGDVNGDGRADLCSRSDGLRCWISAGTHFSRTWVAQSWSDAIGLSDPSFASTLTVGAAASAPPTRALTGTCSVGVGRGTSHMLGVLSLIGLLGLAVRRVARRKTPLATRWNGARPRAHRRSMRRLREAPSE